LEQIGAYQTFCDTAPDFVASNTDGVATDVRERLDALPPGYNFVLHAGQWTEGQGNLNGFGGILSRRTDPA
jgi:hypothetical protein